MLLVLAHGFSGLAFWGYFGTVFAEATFRFGASASRMAVLGASLSVPFILGSLLQGLVVDRWSPKWLSFLGYLAVVIAVPIAWAAPSLTWLYVSAFTVGGAFATIEPSRSALTGLLVEESGLVQANGAIAVAFELSLVLGSLGGGLLLHAYDADVVYAAAFVIAAFPLVLILPVPDVRQSGEQPAFSLADLRKGARTTWRHQQLRLLLVVTALAWTLINAFFVLEPLFVKEVLHRGGDAVLYLWAAHGAGALLGAMAVARTKRGQGHEPAFVCSGIVAMGAGMLVYTGVGLYHVALVAAAVMGSGFALFFPPLLALIQRVVSEEQRGRVTGVFVALQETMGLVSSLLILALGGLIVVRSTLMGAGALLAVIGVVGLRSPLRKPETQPVVDDDD